VLGILEEFSDSVLSPYSETVGEAPHDDQDIIFIQSRVDALQFRVSAAALVRDLDIVWARAQMESSWLSATGEICLRKESNSEGFGLCLVTKGPDSVDRFIPFDIVAGLVAEEINFFQFRFEIRDGASDTLEKFA
jgi:hypothetical protein